MFSDGSLLGSLFPSESDWLEKACRFSPLRIVDVLTALILLTIVPRIIMCLQVPAACDDGYYYLWVGSMWEQGQTHQALRYLNINVYPLILCGLHRLGLGWAEAGAFWNVAASGLTILPLYFLIRRLFDDRFATLGCLMFAIHPEFIETSAEPIREPTFWFFLVLSLDLCHRAAVSERFNAITVAAGLAVAAAVHTRTEGWLLVPVAIWWCLFNAPSSVAVSRRAIRAGLILAMLPVFLLVINVTLLRNHDRWEWGRFTPVRNFIEWVRKDSSPERVAPILSTTATESTTSTVPAHPKSAVAPPAKPAAKLPPITVSPTSYSPHASKTRRRSTSPARVYISQLGQNLEYFNLIFLAIGLLVLRTRLFGKEVLPLSFLFWTILLAVWVRLTQIGSFNGRYFLSAYFVCLPTTVAGAIQTLALIQRGLQRTLSRPVLRRAVFFVPVLSLIGGYWFDAFTTQHFGRDHQVALGNWLNRNYGPFKHVVTDPHSARVGYIARQSVADVAYYDGNDLPPDLTADLVILCPLPGYPPDAVLVQRAQKDGLTLVPFDEFPQELSGYYVFRRAKPTPPPTIAARPDTATAQHR